MEAASSPDDIVLGGGLVLCVDKNLETSVKGQLLSFFGLVVLLLWLGFFLSRISTVQNSTLGKYTDMAASWWKLHFVYRQDALNCNSVLKMLGMPLQIFEASDLYVVALGVAGWCGPAARSKVMASRRRSLPSTSQ